MACAWGVDGASPTLLSISVSIWISPGSSSGIPPVIRFSFLAWSMFPLCYWDIHHVLITEVVVNIPFTRLCLNYTNFRNQNQSNMPLTLWFGFLSIIDNASLTLNGGSSSSISIVFGTSLIGVLYIPNRWGKVSLDVLQEYASSSPSTLSRNNLYFMSEILWLKRTALVSVSLASPNLVPIHPHLFLHRTIRGLLSLALLTFLNCCSAASSCCFALYFFAASNANSALVSIISGSSSGFSSLNFSSSSD